MPKPWPWCLASIFAAAVAAVAPGADAFRPRAYDWPQWQGPKRTAISSETGLLQSWPKEGPRLVWKVKGLGGGYSGPSVSAGRIFGMGFRNGDEVVWALEEATGKELWRTTIAKAQPPRSGPGQEGSRCTPTVDGNFLYALGVNGDLICLKAPTGEVVWTKNLVADFQGTVPPWGYSESPLVDGEKLVVTPGRKTATLAALDKKTGATMWKAQVPQGDEAAYSSIIAAEVNGQRQYIQFLSGGVVGVAAENGQFLWRYNDPSAGINCSTPVYQDNCVFAAANYGKGGGLAQLTREAGQTKATQLYFTKHMKNHHGGMVLVDGYLYGSDEGMLACLDFKTGKVMWEERRAGKGSIAYADGQLYYRNEGGPIILAEANAREYVEHGRFNQPERSRSPAWAHPVIANGKLYIRDQDLVLCYDVKQH